MRYYSIFLLLIFFCSCSSIHKDVNGLSCNGLHGRNVGAEKLLADDQLAKKMPKYRIDKSNN